MKKKPAKYVYLMERVRGRTFKTIVTFRREIKIGISVNSHQREDQVNDGIPGKVILIFERKIRNARTLEKRLHADYEKFNFEPHGAKKGSGRTEFFRLWGFQVWEIKNTIDEKSGNGPAILFFTLAALAIAAMIAAGTKINF